MVEFCLNYSSKIEFDNKKNIECRVANQIDTRTSGNSKRFMLIEHEYDVNYWRTNTIDGS